MASGELQVDIVARIDKLEKALNQAEKKTKQTADKMDRSMGKAGGSFEKVANIGAKIVSVYALMEVTVAAIGTATEAVRAITAAWEGDAKGVAKHMGGIADVLKNLPGLGAVVTQVENLADNILGVSSSIRKMEEDSRKLAETIKKQAEAAKLLVAAREGAFKAEQELKLRKAQSQAGGETLKSIDVRREIARENLLAEHKAKRQVILDSDLREAKKQEALKELKREGRAKLQLIKEEHHAKRTIMEIEIAMRESADRDRREEEMKALQERIAAEKKAKKDEEVRITSNMKRLQMEGLKSQMAAAQSQLGGLGPSTATASTAMGSFTFGTGVQERIAKVNDEMKNIQSQMLEIIRGPILAAMRATTVGFF